MNMKIKIKIISILLLLLLCLSSCSPRNMLVESFGSGKPDIPLMISAEILSSKVSKNESFEIKIGLGRATNYSNATLEIYAPNLIIISSDGTRFEEYYKCEYPDFNDEKFGVYFDEEKLKLSYFESLHFEYVGTKDEYTGGISFHISAIQSSDTSENATIQDLTPDSQAIAIYYKVNGEYIELTTKRLDITPENPNLTAQ